MSKEVIQTVLDGAEQKLNEVEHEVDALIQPVRRSVLRRFPILFLLLVSFGVAATFFGFERLIQEVTFLNDRPLLVLSIGFIVLAGTGTLYKKLG